MTYVSMNLVKIIERSGISIPQFQHSHMLKVGLRDDLVEVKHQSGEAWSKGLIYNAFVIAAIQLDCQLLEYDKQYGKIWRDSE